MLARMLADAVMVNLALAGALALRLLVAIAFQGRTGPEQGNEFWEYASGYFMTGWLLTAISLTLFAMHGFYTYGRNYQGRYKALVITEAVSQSYLVYALLTYLIWEKFGLDTVPRGALVLAWMLNLGMTLASRTWTFLWEKVIRPEREALVKLREPSGRNVLVIGGAGYIGSALLPKLLNAGFRVRVLDLFLYGNEPIRQVEGHPALELVHGDFRQVQKVVEAMRGMDAVVHLGAIVGDPACDLDETVTLTVNLSATQMIAQVAKASGIRRFVFASTCSVYGACDELLDERSEVQPISLYGHTKLAAERGLQKMADREFSPTILRFATIYGLSGRTRFDLVVNLLAAKAKTEGRITVNGGGQWRPFVHVDDAANAVFAVMKAPLDVVGNEIFNVGSDEQNKTIQQIGQLIREQVIAAELIVNEDAADKRNYRVSFSKIRNLLGYLPNWTIEQGVAQVIEAVASGDIRDYKDARYSNVKFLSESGAIEIIRADDDWARELSRPRAEPEFAA
jgi:nucleoside-diphosphate-sugar epimerase